jgi:phosphoglycolate phosphatase
MSTPVPRTPDGGPRRGAALFDLDGTLVDSRTDIARSANHARCALGLPPLEIGEVGRHVGDGAEKLIERLTPGLPPERQREALATFRAHYLEHCCEETRAYDGIPEALDRLRERGWALGVVTNKPMVFTEKILVGLGMRARFAAIHAGDAVRKPDPAAVHACLGVLGAPAESSWMIGDHHTDLHAGNAAGCRVLFCRWGFGHKDGARADVEIDAPSAIPAALDHR